ncbi:MAG: zinc metalloprotease [Nocardioidaceae bacterium]|nr:zinc metalloprotease [Nocardioidaceae bacterium]
MARLRKTSAALIGVAALALAIPAAPAQAANPIEKPAAVCIEPGSDSDAQARGAQRTYGDDHRDVSPRQQRAIERRTDAILKNKGVSEKRAGSATATIPTYIHVMLDKDGNGDVTRRQVVRQIAVLNNTFAGGESDQAANTGFTFDLVDVDRYYNNAWHNDHASTKYRSLTREGGADALNIWLVDFKYLGVATFPWDYERNGDVDGIRVHYDSLPGGSITNYNLGETATHEAGHWLGLFHTFQGGCTEENDGVADTPAQSSPTFGCPEGRDSCALPGLDPIENYMDYSFDSCYTEFSTGQSDRMSTMFTAYRS